jgi:hypothetical protein
MKTYSEQFMEELSDRPVWSSLPDDVICQIVANAEYIFDRPDEIGEAYRLFVTSAEEYSLHSEMARLVATGDSYGNALCKTALTFCDIASAHAKEAYLGHVLTPRTQDALFIADVTACSALACDRYCLQMYYFIASNAWHFAKNKEAARLWCQRYNKAESDFFNVPEDELSSAQRATRKVLRFPESGQQALRELARYSELARSQYGEILERPPPNLRSLVQDLEAEIE